MSIAEKLITIAENEQKVYNAGQLATLKDSQYMNGKESGAIVSVNDVTPIEHNVGVKVASKNLFRPNYADYTQNRFYSYVYVGSVNMRMSFTDKDTTVDVNGIQVGFMADINNVQGGANWAFKSGAIQANNSNVSSINNSALCPYIVIYPNTEDVFNRITARYDIQVEIGTTTTPFTPFVDDVAGVEVARYGKNLVNVADKTFKSYSNGYLSNYIDITALRDKKIAYQLYVDFSNTIESTANAATRIFVYDENETLVRTMYGNRLNYTNGKSIVVTDLSNTAKYVRLGAAIYFDGTKPAQPNSSIVVKNIQLEIGGMATEYEPYTETIYTANADGTVEGIKSISPNMTLIPNNNAVTVECEYLRDIDLYIDNLLKSVAMIGGE